MPALLDSPPQLPSTCGWGALYPVVEEAVKPRHSLAVPPPAASYKKPAYSGKKKNLDTCTEALGCETGGVDGGADAENADMRKRRATEEAEVVVSACQATCRERRPLPPPLTTLARGVSRVRMVHERRDGRLEVRAVRSPGILEAERGDGRLRLRLLPLAGNDAAAMCCRQLEPEAEKMEEAKEAEDGEEEEGEFGFLKYLRGGRCADPEGGAAAVRLGKQWEPEQAAAFWVATS